jgi:thioredoxin 1
MSGALEVTEATFEAEVLKSALPVMADFYTTWCGPCKRLAPLVDEVSRDYAGRIKTVKIDADLCAPLAAQHEVMGFPTLLFFRGGQAVGRLLGLQPKARIVEEVQKLLGS